MTAYSVIWVVLPNVGHKCAGVLVEPLEELSGQEEQGLGYQAWVCDDLNVLL